MRINNECGTAAVEFAIVLPVLVVLIFGMIEFSILFYNKAMLTNACREGARYGIVYRALDGVRSPHTPEEIKEIVLEYSGEYMINFGPHNLTADDIFVDQSEGTDPRDPLTVSATYQYDFAVLPGFIEALAGGVNIGARSIMLME